MSIEGKQKVTNKESRRWKGLETLEIIILVVM